MKDRGYLSWVAPISVGVLAVALWHVLVKAFNVPHYLVPSPALVVQTLIADWGLLFGSLLILIACAALLATAAHAQPTAAASARVRRFALVASSNDGGAAATNVPRPRCETRSPSRSSAS